MAFRAFFKKNAKVDETTKSAAERWLQAFSSFSPSPPSLPLVSKVVKRFLDGKSVKLSLKQGTIHDGTDIEALVYAFSVEPFAFDRISLRHNELEDVSCSALSALVSSSAPSSLRYIDFSNNKFTDSTASALLQAMQSNPDIMEINLKGNAVSSDLLSQLSKLARQRAAADLAASSGPAVGRSRSASLPASAFNANNNSSIVSNHNFKPEDKDDLSDAAASEVPPLHNGSNESSSSQTSNRNVRSLRSLTVSSALFPRAASPPPAAIRSHHSSRSTSPVNVINDADANKPPSRSSSPSPSDPAPPSIRLNLSADILSNSPIEPKIVPFAHADEDDEAEAVQVEEELKKALSPRRMAAMLDAANDYAENSNLQEYVPPPLHPHPPLPPSQRVLEQLNLRMTQKRAAANLSPALAAGSPISPEEVLYVHNNSSSNSRPNSKPSSPRSVPHSRSQSRSHSPSKFSASSSAPSSPSKGRAQQQHQQEEQDEEEEYVQTPDIDANLPLSSLRAQNVEERNDEAEEREEREEKAEAEVEQQKNELVVEDKQVILEPQAEAQPQQHQQKQEDNDEEAEQDLEQAEDNTDYSVTALDLSNKRIADLEELNLHRFTRLVHLDLSRNALESIPENALPPTLEHLDVSWNGLSSLSSLKDLNFLRIVRANHNMIRSISGFDSSLTLKELHLTDNRITRVANLEQCRLLDVLDLSNNAIASLQHLRTLSVNNRLRSLVLTGNPVSMIQTFRVFILNLVPKLETIDGVPVLESKSREPNRGRPSAAAAAAASSSSASTPRRSSSIGPTTPKTGSKTVKRTSAGAMSSSLTSSVAALSAVKSMQQPMTTSTGAAQSLVASVRQSMSSSSSSSSSSSFVEDNDDLVSSPPGKVAVNLSALIASSSSPPSISSSALKQQQGNPSLQPQPIVVKPVQTTVAAAVQHLLGNNSSVHEKDIRSKSTSLSSRPSVAVRPRPSSSSSLSQSSSAQGLARDTSPQRLQQYVRHSVNGALSPSRLSPLVRSSSLASQNSDGYVSSSSPPRVISIDISALDPSAAYNSKKPKQQQQPKLDEEAAQERGHHVDKEMSLAEVRQEDQEDEEDQEEQHKSDLELAFEAASPSLSLSQRPSGIPVLARRSQPQKQQQQRPSRPQSATRRSSSATRSKTPTPSGAGFGSSSKTGRSSAPSLVPVAAAAAPSLYKPSFASLDLSRLAHLTAPTASSSARASSSRAPSSVSSSVTTPVTSARGRPVSASANPSSSRRSASSSSSHHNAPSLPAPSSSSSSSSSQQSASVSSSPLMSDNLFLASVALSASVAASKSAPSGPVPSAPGPIFHDNSLVNMSVISDTPSSVSAFQPSDLDSDFGDMSTERVSNLRGILKGLNQKISKLYSWHLIELDVVSKQQIQLKNVSQQLETTRSALLQALQNRSLDGMDLKLIAEALGNPNMSSSSSISVPSQVLGEPELQPRSNVFAPVEQIQKQESAPSLEELAEEKSSKPEAVILIEGASSSPVATSPSIPLLNLNKAVQQQQQQDEEKQGSEPVIAVASIEREEVEPIQPSPRDDAEIAQALNSVPILQNNAQEKHHQAEQDAEKEQEQEDDSDDDDSDISSDFGDDTFLPLMENEQASAPLSARHQKLAEALGLLPSSSSSTASNQQKPAASPVRYRPSLLSPRSQAEVDRIIQETTSKKSESPLNADEPASRLLLPAEAASLCSRLDADGAQIADTLQNLLQLCTEEAFDEAAEFGQVVVQCNMARTPSDVPPHYFKEVKNGTKEEEPIHVEAIRKSAVKYAKLQSVLNCLIELLHKPSAEQYPSRDQISALQAELQRIHS